MRLKGRTLLPSVFFSDMTVPNRLGYTIIGLAGEASQSDCSGCLEARGVRFSSRADVKKAAEIQRLFYL
jgi:hypothetical protein